jgi:TPP-dependent pyruvate/acetoin dehydrogenase alpha subunit
MVTVLGFSESELAELRDAANRRIKAVRDEAQAAPPASPEEMRSDVYAMTEVRAWAS